MKGNHLKHMLFGGVALLAVFLAAGVPLGRALPYAIGLACPLMMVVMMVMMGRGMNGQGRHDQTASSAAVPAPRASSDSPIELTKDDGAEKSR